MNMRRLAALITLCSVPALSADVRLTTLVVAVPPACAISIVGSRFTPDVVNEMVSGEILFRYAVRTSRAVGSGAIKLWSADEERMVKVSTRLSGASAMPSGIQSVNAADSALIATFAADTHSTNSGDMGAISWSAAGATPPRLSLTIDCQ
jgi:hypothetical protein